jgi:hypothetical protein
MDSDEAARIIASYPLDAERVVVRFAGPVKAEEVSYSLASGQPVHDVGADEGMGGRVVLTVDPMASVPLVIDHVILSDGNQAVFGPPFAHGLISPMEIKVPNFERRFPFTSRLVGVHVSVMCCTGCDGGVHDRGLVVLNDHLGGGWSGIWVKTPQRIEGPYPRWQRMVFAGGVINDHGSTEVVDHGWMEIAKGNEAAHHSPSPLPVATVDIPAEHTTTLRARSLDGSWVEFASLVVETAERVEPGTDSRTERRLPYTEIVFSDDSGGRSIAYLYQEQREDVRAGTRIDALRGFVHAELPGQYVLVSDKPEDLKL